MGKASRRKGQKPPEPDREGVRGASAIVNAICRSCGRRRVMEAVYRVCRRCITAQTLAALEEEFPSEPEPKVRRRIYP